VKERPFSAPSLDSDATQQELPGGTGVSPVGGSGVTPAASQDPLPPIDPVVTRLGQRWMDLVETIVIGRGSARVNGETYRSIHTLLLQACRAAIDDAKIPERRAFYEECLSIAQPWLKLQTFYPTERHLLLALLKRGKEIERELNGGKVPWTIRQGIGLMLVTLTPLAAVLWYWHYGRRWLPSLFRELNGEFSLSSLRSAWSFLQTHPPLLMGLIFPLLVMLSIGLLWRTSRI
jgi:hypothetical protein